ncbi:MAG: NUDIX hydrolase [bacterium]|nr:NUDIX hydrolase [bacterium]
MFKKLSSKSLHKDHWLEFFLDDIAFPDGSTGTYAWAKRMNGVAVVIATKDRKILLQKEYRYVISEYSWEIQGGGIDEGETAKQAAVREIFEETGLTISESSLQRLGKFYSLNSFCTENNELFLAVVEAADVHTSGSEVGELISELRFVDFAEAIKMIDSGEITDAFTANAIQIAIRRLSKFTNSASAKEQSL